MTLLSARPRYVRTGAGLLSTAALLSVTAFSCGPQAKAYSSQCAFVIGNGAGDNHSVKKIVYPQTSFRLGDDLGEFVPCNARNFIVAPRADNRDRETPTIARTKKPVDVPTAKNGTEVKVYWTSYWALNQDDATLRAFVPFCEKYNCYSDEDKVSGNANYATPGWNGMLQENYSPAADRALQRAMREFPSDISDDQARWNEIATRASTYMLEELRVATRSGPHDFFCGGGNTRAGEKCEPPTFKIDDVAPTDPRVEQQQKDAQVTQSAKQLNTERIAENKRLYGPLSDYYTGLQDVLKTCKETGQSCTIVIGNPAGVSVSPGGK